MLWHNITAVMNILTEVTGKKTHKIFSQDKLSAGRNLKARYAHYDSVLSTWSRTFSERQFICKYTFPLKTTYYITYIWVFPSYFILITMLRYKTKLKLLKIYQWSKYNKWYFVSNIGSSSVEPRISSRGRNAMNDVSPHTDHAHSMF